MNVRMGLGVEMSTSVLMDKHLLSAETGTGHRDRVFQYAGMEHLYRSVLRAG